MKRAEEIVKKFADRACVTERELKIGKKSVRVLFKSAVADARLVGDLVRSLERYEERELHMEGLMRNAVYVAESAIIKPGKRAADEAVSAIVSGDAVVIAEGIPEFLEVSTRDYVTRSITEPPTSTVTFGPREGFIEDLRTNLNLISRRLKSPALAVKRTKIGRISNTEVAVVYLDNVAAPEVYQSVLDRLEKIDIDSVVDCHTIMPYLEENPLSMFAQVGVSEKPDVVEAKLSEGRVAIFVDGSPLIMTVPFILLEDYQNSEDYYERPTFSSFARKIRLIAVFLGIVLPGIYVAMQTFHFDIFPLRFMITVMTAVNGIPFSPLPEILFVILLFEVIKEASVRMPRAVGMAMSIVGGLVLGDTAVKAGIISSPAVMIMALSSIAIYTVPNQVGTLSLLRVMFTLLGGLGGLYFLSLSGLALLIYLCNINVYGASYLSPLTPLMPGDLKDAFYLDSAIRMKKRPKAIPNINRVRRGG
ncbi:MAG: spore germination protein [Clostridiales bacterium]|jgi:spore germination protein KA|nr:spore germination protein [Clostridiales bacterium]